MGLEGQTSRELSSTARRTGKSYRISILPKGKTNHYISRRQPNWNSLRDYAGLTPVSLLIPLAGGEAAGMLVIVDGYAKIQGYVFGQQEIIVESYHKPLEMIFKKALCQCPLHLQRTRLSLQKCHKQCHQRRCGKTTLCC